MRVLLVGSGAREHALADALRRSSRVSELIATPGNAGIAQLAELINPGSQAHAIADEAARRAVDLVVVGPENALADGVVDAMGKHNIPAFGPTAAGAQLESSKQWCKQLMADYNIPTPASESFDDPEQALKYVRTQTAPLVIKADGLAYGKGVQICQTIAEAEEFVRAAMQAGIFGSAGATVLVEEFITGWEFSLMFFTDGTSYSLMPHTQDHKAAYDGDTGPNTGGMGAYTHIGTLDDAMVQQCEETIIKPLLKGLAARGVDYRGVITGNLIVDERGPKILEFNARCGDPESPTVLPLLTSDFVDIVEAAIAGKLHTVTPEWDQRAALSVIMASHNYPATPRTGDLIEGLGATIADTYVYHAGTKATENGIITSGGRVLTITGIGDTLAAARDKAYERVSTLHFADAQYRNDIGWRTLGKPA